MAKKKSETSENTKIRRIKATDDAPVKKSTANSSKKDLTTNTKSKSTAKSTKAPEVKKTPKGKTAKIAKTIDETPTKNPFKAFSRYVKGAWYELRQVRWPNRTATWSMTLAIILFTAFFVVLVILLDTGFNWLFEQILK